MGKRGGGHGVNEGMIVDKGIIRFNLRFAAVRYSILEIYVNICLANMCKPVVCADMFIYLFFVRNEIEFI